MTDQTKPGQDKTYEQGKQNPNQQNPRDGKNQEGDKSPNDKKQDPSHTKE